HALPRAQAVVGERHLAGQEELRALVGEMPFTYYGLRAGQRVGPAAPRAGSGPMPLPRLRADRLRRLRLMLLAGALEEVRIELPGLVRKARGVGDRGALAELLAAAGAYHEAERLIVDTERAELARGLDPARRTLWVHAWPRAFSTEVEAAARAAGIPEALLLSVMREESGFRPKVLSSVGARGLVQIMPTTGTHLARLLSWPQFDPDQLFDPETNLTLGARYLRNLLEEFDGRAAAAVAAYNAGENAVARWIDRNGGLEEDEWVEAIPYDQTRSYVRRVLRSLHVYRTLYPEAASVGAGADDTMSTTGTRKGGDAGTVALEVR
ncbi:MAG: lytic transglycosylase domain-containing protein, partial [Myxococcota bacterium]|nr:lytic transglycosylase domain-containing protein [Myxococcota bacterium]